jgi:hypothetical protein
MPPKKPGDLLKQIEAQANQQAGLEPRRWCVSRIAQSLLRIESYEG